ncbi:MAG TPA: hypothetical protein VF230_06775 [Acidimicrobiales bacterium]
MAADAGLSGEVADVLVLAAASVGEAYTVVYEVDGADVIVMSDPPRRRVDVSQPGEADIRTIETQESSLRCTRSAAGWKCESRPLSEAPGAFRAEALVAVVDSLVTRPPDGTDLRVERRAVAGVRATCLVTSDRTFCVSKEGVALLLEGFGNGDLAAVDYRADVEDDAFDAPAAPDADR